LADPDARVAGSDRPPADDLVEPSRAYHAGRGRPRIGISNYDGLRDWIKKTGNHVLLRGEAMIGLIEEGNWRWPERRFERHDARNKK